jgi:hypothetical protein
MLHESPRIAVLPKRFSCYPSSLMPRPKKKPGKGGKRKGAGRPPENGRVVITARIKRNLRDGLKAKAAESGGIYTVNSLIESFIEAGLQQPLPEIPGPTE